MGIETDTLDNDFIPTIMSRRRGERAAADLLDGSGEFGGVRAEEWAPEQGITIEASGVVAPAKAEHAG